MKKRLPCFFFLLTWFPSFSQLGITVAPTQNRMLDWQVLIENYLTHRRTDFLRQGMTAVLDYSFSSKSQVVKFQPGVHFTRATHGYPDHAFEAYLVGFQLNAGIYPFRSKSGNQTQKRDIFERFWLQISPGTGLVTLKYDQPQFKDGQFTGFKHFDDQGLSFNLGAQIALDFHLSDFLTVAPVAGIRYFSKLTWTGFSEAVSQGSVVKNFDRSDWRQVMLGLRMELQVKRQAAKTEKPMR